MSVTFEVDGATVLVYVSQDAERKDFDELFKAINAYEPLEEVRVDLKDFYYIKSEMLAQILFIKKTVNGKNARAVLLNVSENVYHILETTDLLRFFIIRQDFNRYSIKELIEMFGQPDCADAISDHIAANYSAGYQDALMLGASSDDPLVQEYCILTMGKAQDTDAMEIMRKCLDSVYPNVVRASILALGWLGDGDSKKRFYEFVSSEDIEIAEAAGASISLISNESDAENLRKLSASKNPNIRIIIAGTLSLINGDEAYKIIIKMLDEETEEPVRKELARRIAFFNRQDATIRLISMLDDNSMSVQEAAAAGLERTGLRGHEETVLKKIGRGDAWVSYFAIKALGQFCNSECTKYLKEIYGKSEENVRLAIIEALGNSLSADTDTFFKERLSDENEDIRKTALAAIYKSDKTAAAAEALKLLETDPSWLVRYKAVEIIGFEKPDGYVKILTDIKNKDNSRYVQDKIASVLGT